METAKLLTECLTALASCTLVIVAWIQLPLVSRQVNSLAEQIRLSRVAEINAERRTREWETLKACDRYNTDQILEAATQRAWYTSDAEINYKKSEVDHRDLTIIVNYLDGIAIGVQQGLHIEDLVKDHIGSVFGHAVIKWIEGGLFDTSGIETMASLHARWYRSAKPTSYSRPVARN
jgi:hypothetical protein